MDDKRARLEAVADDLAALGEFADPGEALNLLLRGDPNWLKRRIATLIVVGCEMGGMVGEQLAELERSQAAKLVAKVAEMKGEADADS